MRPVTITADMIGDGAKNPEKASASYTLAAADSGYELKERSDFVCDGVNDEIEIQAALTLTAGGVVYLLQGNYSIGSSAGIDIPDNTTLDMSSNAILKFQNSCPDNGPNNEYMFKLQVRDSVIVRGGILDGNKANQDVFDDTQIAIYAGRVTSSRFESITFKDFGRPTGNTGYAMELADESEYNIVTKCKATGCTREHFTAYRSSFNIFSYCEAGDGDDRDYIMHDCFATQVLYCKSTNAGGTGIHWNHLEPGHHVVGHNVCIGNQIRNAGEMGIFIDCEYKIQVKDNYVDNCGRDIVDAKDGIYLTNTYGADVSHNTVKSSGRAGIFMQYLSGSTRSYSTGTATTNGTTAVVGTGTEWRTDMEGRLFKIDSVGTYVRIAEVTDFTHLTLESNYGAAAGAYTIKYNQAHNIISFNNVSDNGKDESSSGWRVAIYLHTDCQENTIIGNQGDKGEKQYYGIRILAGNDNNIVTGNNLQDIATNVNLQNSGSNNIVTNNIGYVTENQGKSTGTGAQQTIAHGLDETPTHVLLTDEDSGATPYQSAGADATNIYVTAVNAKKWQWRAFVR